MNEPADLMNLAELRFFRDLIDAERMKVFKAFDLLPQDHDEQIPHAIQRKLFEQIANTRQAASVSQPEVLTGDADLAHPERLQALSDAADYVEKIGARYHSGRDIANGIRCLGPRSPTVAQASSNPADEIIGQIEERFPDWKGFRDLVDCIDVTLHRLRGGL